MFLQYCATCQGIDRKGNGPAASAIKTAPTDLAQLTRKHDRKYPANMVACVPKFGNAPGAHGRAALPVCGPLLPSLDRYHDTVRQRISNLVEPHRNARSEVGFSKFLVLGVPRGREYASCLFSCISSLLPSNRNQVKTDAKRNRA